MVKALDEIGLPLDLIGGCSMGSIIAAQRALGWPWQEILDRNREMWLRSGSLFDYTIPMVSLIAGRKAERMAAKIFGDVFVQDLWTNFFCVMCDVYIHPPVEDYKIFDFNALDKLVDCGYVAMHRHMDGWRGAVSRAEWQD